MPPSLVDLVRRDTKSDADPHDGAKPKDPNILIIEAWSQGFLVGSIVVMCCITIANMRRGVRLHKLILLELFLGMWHGFFIFFDGVVYGRILSITAVALYCSLALHNVIAWMKVKPFLSKIWSRIFIGTVLITLPYWIVDAYGNFEFFNNWKHKQFFIHVRPYEALFRDPWWVITTIVLFYNIKTRYSLGLIEVMNISPRFGIMVTAMVVSVLFTLVDVVFSAGQKKVSNLPEGINPFWKLAFVFKCLTDAVVLDDFKSALDRLHAYKFNNFSPSGELKLETSPTGSARRGRSIRWAAPRDGSDTALTDLEKGVEHRERKRSSWPASPTSNGPGAQSQAGASHNPGEFQTGSDLLKSLPPIPDNASTHAYPATQHSPPVTNRGRTMSDATDLDDDDYATAMRQLSNVSTTQRPRFSSDSPAYRKER